ncbi:MAG: nitrogenase component 1 [Burkholderiales bacterium]|jgi:nitrogenase molybdenum-iron protein alpha/beta subunit|nr:nitrogenase component 1 [Burkholderiales bacterium]
MSKLLYSLPPLSPDYSGVASVFHDIEALTIIHDASGCTGTYTGYDEPRWFGSQSPVFCSGLREMDAIMGDDEKLYTKIETALKSTHAPCVAIIGSPVPMVIGFDFAGFASLVETRTGCSCLSFPTTGLAYYDVGQKSAYLALAKKFLDPSKAEPLKNTVNILGASVLDGFDEKYLNSIIAFLHKEHLNVGAVWGMRSPLTTLRTTPNAAVNWVVTAAALPLARYLYQTFGTPFVAGLPLGEHETTRILNYLKSACAGHHPPEKMQFAPPPKLESASHGKPSTAKTLIIGEGLHSASLRARLEQDNECEPVRVGSFFTEAQSFLTEHDVMFQSEQEAYETLADPTLEIVIGDPLFRDLIPRQSKILLIDLPHRAISGRLYM